MIIDARPGDIVDALKQLKELFSSHDNLADPLEVLVRNRKDAGEIRAFASMTGFKTALYHEDGYYRIMIIGASCRCHR